MQKLKRDIYLLHRRVMTGQPFSEAFEAFAIANAGRRVYFPIRRNRINKVRVLRLLQSKSYLEVASIMSCSEWRIRQIHKEEQQRQRHLVA